MPTDNHPSARRSMVEIVREMQEANARSSEIVRRGVERLRMMAEEDRRRREARWRWWR